MQEFLRHIEQGNYGYGLLVLFVFLAINTKNISSFLDDKKRRKLSILCEACNSKDVSDGLKAHFKEEIEVEYFRITYGVKLDVTAIKALIALKQMTEDRIPFGLIISARNFITKHNIVRIGNIDIALFVSNLIFVILLLFLLGPLTASGGVVNYALATIAMAEIVFGVYQLYQFFAASILKLAVYIKFQRHEQTSV
ncbi:hypothetical protein [Enterovibrio norvegicus]|uniref:hypothetical protein n=1 Tax=Enterovibrio norvegicus TaxID=188144 RepID=UPI00354CEDD3